MNKTFYIILFASVFVLTSGSDKPKFSYKTYGNVANFFENENDLIRFFDFHKGDVVAEIGAGNGENLLGFSRVADSTVFYLQDIDSTVLSQSNFDKMAKRCKKLKKPSSHTFYRCIGTEKSTNLPDNSFDKIILISSFHEFTFMDEMMTDIYKKLKPSGQLYILEVHCLTHKNITADETIELLKKYNFSLVKKDGKDLNNSSGLYRTIFKKVPDGGR